MNWGFLQLSFKLVLGFCFVLIFSFYTKGKKKHFGALKINIYDTKRYVHQSIVVEIRESVNTYRRVPCIAIRLKITQISLLDYSMLSDCPQNNEYIIISVSILQYTN